MRFAAVLGLVLAFAATAPTALAGQGHAASRLPVEVLDVVPPSAWVQGDPGRMTVQRLQCRDLPPSELRRRVVDVAVQEWAFFGYPVLDRRNNARFLPPGSSANGVRPTFESSTSGRAPLVNAGEAGRVAATIGGYWAVTPEGPGIVSTQNQAWSGNGGVGARWRAPWSAAFISWVMCEAGMGSADSFRRAIAHWTYIDQAIRARDGRAPGAAYVAYDIGEEVVEPGDMLCAGRRPQYRNVAERRRQMGSGASTHCDIVVEIDEAGGRILTVGGNVLRSVSLKVFPGTMGSDGVFRPSGGAGRPLFVHLKLQADPIEPDALARSRVFQALACSHEGVVAPRVAVVVSELGVGFPAGTRC